MFEGDEVLKSSLRVLLDSRDEERVVTMSIQGAEGRSLSSLQGPERSIVLRWSLRSTGVSSEVYSAFLSLPLHLPRLPPRIQRPQIPRRTFIETSTRLYRARSYEIGGTGKDSAVVDEPLRSKRKRSRSQVFEERLIHFLG